LKRNEAITVEVARADETGVPRVADNRKQLDTPNPLPELAVNPLYLQTKFLMRSGM